MFIKKFEKLTIQTVSNAFFLADALGLDPVTKDSENFDVYRPDYTFLYGRDDMKVYFTFHFDEFFKVDLTAGTYPTDVESIKITLMDKKHSLTPYVYKRAPQEENEDKEIIWKHDGPWAVMFEKKIKEIYKLYENYLYKKERTEQENKAYFKEALKYNIIPCGTKDIDYMTLESLLVLGAKHGLVGEKKRDDNYTVYRYDSFVIENKETDILYYSGNYHTEPRYINIHLKDGSRALSLCSQEVDNKGKVTLPDVFYAEALTYTLKKLKKEINIAKKEENWLKAFYENDK